MEQYLCYNARHTMAAFSNHLTWSFSRMRMFHSCRRRYYYHHYLKWGGWSYGAPPERSQAYRLSKMKSMPSYAGELVHQGIADALRRFRRHRIVMTPEESIATAHMRWMAALAQSESGRWQRDPKGCICLLEDYYNHLDREDKAVVMWERIAVCLTNFHASRTWRDLQRSRPKHWLAMDGDAFQTVPIDDIAVHGRPDLGYGVRQAGEAQGQCYVFDWKTGSMRDSDMVQLRYYALYAESAWGYAPDTVKARLIYLYPDLCEETVEITTDALDNARRTLAESYAEMHAVLADSEKNLPLDISFFPITERPSLCRHCSFQELCPPPE